MKNIKNYLRFFSEQLQFRLQLNLNKALIALLLLSASFLLIFYIKTQRKNRAIICTDPVINELIDSIAKTKSELQMIEDCQKSDPLQQWQINAINDWMSVKDNKALIRYQYKEDDINGILSAIQNALIESIKTFEAMLTADGIKAISSNSSITIEQIQEEISLKTKEFIRTNNVNKTLTLNKKSIETPSSTIIGHQDK